MKTLFDKTELGKTTLKNRFFRAATWMNMADEEGFPTQKAFEACAKLAIGGIGTIITGYANVCENEKASPGMLGAYSEKFIPIYKELTRFVHDAGANIILQVAYGGSQTSIWDEQQEIWGPSAVIQKKFNVPSVEMTKENIEELKFAFARAAYIAKSSGFDGIQIHAAHGYLLSQFLSPYYNQRTDEYGGSIENRARIIFEIYEAMRENVGDDFNILIKINCADFEDGGLEFPDSKYVCTELSKRGIDAIEISGGVAKNEDGKEVFRKKIMNDISLQSYFKDFAAEIAEEIDTPIILVGGNRTPALMEEILNTTKIQYMSLSRPLICEPDLISKWTKNPEYKPKCVACNKCWAKTGTECIFARKAALKKAKA